MALDILVKAISCKKCNEKWFKQDAPVISSEGKIGVYTCDICKESILTDKEEPLVLVFDVGATIIAMIRKINQFHDAFDEAMETVSQFTGTDLSELLEKKVIH